MEIVGFKGYLKEVEDQIVDELIVEEEEESAPILVETVERTAPISLPVAEEQVDRFEELQEQFIHTLQSVTSEVTQQANDLVEKSNERFAKQMLALAEAISKLRSDTRALGENRDRQVTSLIANQQSIMEAQQSMMEMLIQQVSEQDHILSDHSRVVSELHESQRDMLDVIGKLTQKISTISETVTAPTPVSVTVPERRGIKTVERDERGYITRIIEGYEEDK